MTDTVRVIAWNIVEGGRERREDLVLALANAKPDIIMLSEYMEGKQEEFGSITEFLAEAGYPYRHASVPTGEPVGALLASRWPIASRPGYDYIGHLANYWAAGIVETPNGPLRAAAVSIPTGRAPQMADKRELLQWIASQAAEWHAEGPTIIGGDFNADHRDDTGGTDKRAVGEPAFGALFRSGWTDLWRTLHEPGEGASYWMKSGKPFLLDHIIASPHVSATAMELRTRDETAVFVPTPELPADPLLSRHAMVIADVVVDGTSSAAVN